MNRNFKRPKIVAIAERDAELQRKKKEQKRKDREELRRKAVPMLALVIANIIFVSLDVRAFQAVYLLTSSYLLSIVTVMVSGILALIWWDFLYPHARRHSNDTQVAISLVSTALSIITSGILAFADYLVTGSQMSSSQGWLWAAVVILTAWQGVALGWWWAIDNHIERDAQMEKAYAEQKDKEDTALLLKTKLESLQEALNALEALYQTHDKAAVRRVAALMGIPLDDEDGDGVPDVFQHKPSLSVAHDTDSVQLKGDPDSPFLPK